MRDFLSVMPEVFLVLTLAAVILAEITYYHEDIRLVRWMSLIGIMGAGIQILIAYHLGAILTFDRVWILDGISLFVKGVIIVLSISTILISGSNEEIPKSKKTEFYAMILASSLALCIVVSAGDLLLIFLSLQFVNIINYFLTCFGKASHTSIEAAVKYIGFTTLGASFFIYGSALLFGFTHTLNLFEIHHYLVKFPLPRELSLVIFMLYFLSFAIQMGVFPMHFLLPDVIQGSPTPVSAFISFGSRIIGFTTAIRIFLSVFAKPGSAGNDSREWEVLGGFRWDDILSIVAGVTMLVGALLALKQRCAKRLVGSLVVCESGFLLMGVLVLDALGIGALLFNFVVEAFSLIGIFYILSCIIRKIGSTDLELIRRSNQLSVADFICLALFLYTLVGLPPTSGFFGKFSLIGTSVEHGRVFLGVLAILSMVISLVSISRFLFFWMGDFTVIGAGGVLLKSTYAMHHLLLMFFLIPLILITVFSNQIIFWAQRSVPFIFW